MINEHNPIALRINHLQDLWMAHRKKKPSAKLLRWLVDVDDISLVDGFYKLESSIHGKIDESLVVMLTNFEDMRSFSYQLTKDWLKVYETELTKYPELRWEEFLEQKVLFEEIENKENIEDFLIQVLISFKRNNQTRDFLFVGIHPRRVAHIQNFNLWCEKMIQQLPDDIGMVLIDYKGEGLHDILFGKPELEEITQTIVVKNQNMGQAYEQIMTQGNPNDAQTAFRICMIEMGKAAKEEKLSQVHQWGKKALTITQSTGQKSFWASAHLVYASFLFQFMDSVTIHELLDKGIRIGLNAPKHENPTAVILQMYAYKGAYHSMCREGEQAFEWFLKQVRYAIQEKEDVIVITAYKNTLIVAQMYQMKTQYDKILVEAFEFGYAHEDEFIQITEFAYIAHLFLETKHTKPNQEEIKTRLGRLLGEDWQENTQNIKIQKP